MSNKELFVLAKSGDEAAKSEIIKVNQGLVGRVVNDYSFNESQKDELFQEGMIGLLEALNNYNPDSKAKFSTYAYKYVKNRVLRQLNIITSNKHIPETVIRSYVAIKREINKYYSENGTEPSYEDLSFILGDKYTPDKIFNIIKSIEESHSIDDEDGAILENQSETESAVDDSQSIDIEQYSEILKPLEKQIIKLRLEGYKYKEIVPIVNLTENKIRKIECSATVKIRNFNKK